jgi:hypothetical protein
VYSQTGVAQYGRGTEEIGDLLTVYAEAFERDADPEDFLSWRLSPTNEATNWWHATLDFRSKPPGRPSVRKKSWPLCWGR